MEITAIRKQVKAKYQFGEQILTSLPLGHFFRISGNIAQCSL
jgi:hypothetical protein